MHPIKDCKLNYLIMTDKANKFTKEIYLVFLFNLAIIFFIAKRYMDFLENTEGLYTKLFLVCNTFSHFFLMALLPFLLSLLVFKVSKSVAATKITNITLSTLLIIFLKVDTIVFSQFRYHLSPIVFKMFFGKKSGDIFQFSQKNILMAVLFVLLIIGGQIALYALARKINSVHFILKPKLVFPAFLITLLFSHFSYAWSSPNHYRPVTQFRNIFPVYFPLTADSLLSSWNLIDENASVKDYGFKIDSENATVTYPLSSIKTANQNPSKNILFIVVDSWQYSCFNEKVTPFLYDFSKQCQVFTNHMSGSNRTTGGIFSLFYGIPATYYDTFTGQKIAPVLLDELQKNNYDLGIYSSSTLENPPFNQNVFSNIKNLRLSSKGDSPSERDSNITEEWLDRIDRRNPAKPFFGFLFYDAAHGFDHPNTYNSPFQPELKTVDYLAMDKDYNPDQLINRYKNSLHFVDSQIQKVLQQLKDKNLLESTLIVITADHGQEFNENKKGYWQHGGNFSKYQVQVPMMIFDASKTPKVHGHKTLHYDISATLLSSVFQVQNPLSDYSFGRNIYETSNRPYFICGFNEKYAVIEDSKITTIEPSGIFEVTDHKLNPLDQKHIDYRAVSNALTEMSVFYSKR